MAEALDFLFRPRHVAVVGASRDPTKRGYQIIWALKEFGYAGRILPVNPKGGEVLGFPVARALSEVEGEIDLAVICTRAEIVPSVLEECARKGVRGAIVLASGSGRSLQEEIARFVRRTGVRVLGPNTSGVLNLSIGLNAIGMREVRAGPLALLVQSGNVALAVITEAMRRSSLGISLCIGVGNEADVGFHECLEYLGHDAETAAILMYVEGVKQGRLFWESARRVARTKPIVLLKGGRSKAGQVAAFSHTGTLAGSYAIWRAALRQAGIIEVTRSDELFHVAETLVTQPVMKEDGGVAVISDGGGHAALAADIFSEYGLPLAELSAETQQRVREILGVEAAVGNPIDVGGPVDTNPSLFAPCLNVVMKDPQVSGVLLAGLFGGYALRFAESLAASEVRAAREIVAEVRRVRKPLVVHSLYAATRSEPLRILSKGGIPVIESLEVACRCLAALSERARFLRESAGADSSRESPSTEPQPPVCLGALDRTKLHGRRMLLETEARELVAAYGVPLVPATFCASAHEVVAAVRQIGGPVAMKAVSAALSHKTEAGGVILNVPDAEHAQRAFAHLEDAVTAYAKSQGLAPDFRGVLVAPMLPPPVVELIAGVKRDETFGPVLMVGMGGVLVEHIGDVTFRLLPLDPKEVDIMLEELRLAPLLKGVRGRPAVDRRALIGLLLALAECALAHPEIEEIELNPIFAYAEGVWAVDVRAALGEFPPRDP